MAEELQNDATVAETVVTEAAVEAPAVKIAVEAIVPGMVVRVHQKIKELNTKNEERERIQIFEGTVIACKGHDVKSASITVRKIASGVGVERIFPLRLPTIDKIEVVKQLDTHRSKLYYLRDYKKRIAERPVKGTATSAPIKKGAPKKKAAAKA